VTIDRGTVLYDLDRLRHAGDLLHEARRRRGGGAGRARGHARERRRRSGRGDDGHRMNVRRRHPNGCRSGARLRPDGYAGYSGALVENLREGRYLAVPLLQWIGPALDETRARELGAPAYPRMLKWLRE
jgi:hypothetical protein